MILGPFQNLYTEYQFVLYVYIYTFLTFYISWRSTFYRTSETDNFLSVIFIHNFQEYLTWFFV